MNYKAGIVGAAGFAGIELVRILANHPSFSIECVTSDSNAGKPLSALYPSFEGVCDQVFSKNEAIFKQDLDVVFLAVPHTAALEIAPKLIARGVSVIDLSADFRLRDAHVYSAWYGVEHTQQELLSRATFGLPELFGEALAQAAEKKAQGNAQLIACAGCYPTSTSLAAAPALRAGLVEDASVVVADAISGVTGAGKKANARTHFCFADENLEAYSVAAHRHTPEIEQILDIPNRLVFTPHLAPLKRGLLSTVTMKAAAPSSKFASELQALYENAYAQSPFVTVLPAGEQPKTSSVVGSNRAHIGVCFDERTNSIIATAAIDNLCKGAAGQAVQCANALFALPQTAGLTSMALPV